VKAKGLIAGGLSADTSKDLRLRMGLDMLACPTNTSPAIVRARRRGWLARGEVTCSPNHRRAIARWWCAQLITPGIAIPVFYDEIADRRRVETAGRL